MTLGKLFTQGHMSRSKSNLWPLDHKSKVATITPPAKQHSNEWI